MKRLLIKNGLLATGDFESTGDVLCEDGKIVQVGGSLLPQQAVGGEAWHPPGADVQIIDATGKIIMPGGVDVHTHLNLDAGIAVSCDDFYSGTVAAASGGTTTIVDHPAFGPAGCALNYQINKYHEMARGRAVIDYGFHGVIQHVDEQALSMMESLAGQGITSFKVYLTYAHKLSDAETFKALRRARELGLVICVHPENDGVINTLRDEFRAAGKTAPCFHPLSRPAECEAEAINRMILLARMADNAPLYIVHLTNALGLEYIQFARGRGQRNLWAETCPQYLLLDESVYSLPGAEGLKFIMCPPLRTPADCEALWQGLDNGIDTVATDHCPFRYDTQKMMGRDDFTLCPSGVPGIEERIPLMFSEGVAKKRISLKRFTELCCETPAKLFGLYPRKGTLAPGSDADIVILDPAKKQTLTASVLHSKVDYCAYEGLEIQGRIEYVFSRGELIVKQGEFCGEPGRGQFLKRDRIR
jgi:dihydropyrimidinase